MKHYRSIRQFGVLLVMLFILQGYGCSSSEITEYEYTELLPPGWQDASAYGINNNGVVVGWGIDGQTQKGFIATPKIIGTSGRVP